MKVHFKNARILNPGQEFSESLGEVVTEGGAIRYVGPAAPRELTAGARTLDLQGNLLMPGLVNAHAHSAMTLFRGLGGDLPLERWLYDRIFPLEDKLTPEDVYAGTLLACLEYLSSGITSVGDMYFFPEALFQAYDEAGLRVKYVMACSDPDGDTDRELRNLEERYAAFKDKTPLFSCLLGAHAEYTCSEALLTGISDFAVLHREPTYIHLSETLKEVGDCTVRHSGLTPPQYLHKLGFFEHGGTAAHVVHADKDDLDLLKQCGVNVAHNPSSNLKLGSGIAPVYAMLDRGLCVALGTDGAASNDRLDLFREMYLMAVLQKGAMYDAGAVTAEEAVRAATVQGARALYLEKVGKVEEGWAADLIVVDLDRPHWKPLNDLPAELVYAAKSSDVILTMVGGEILYENGAFPRLDPPKIFDLCQKSIGRLRG